MLRRGDWGVRQREDQCGLLDANDVQASAEPIFLQMGPKKSEKS